MEQQITDHVSKSEFTFHPEPGMPDNLISHRIDQEPTHEMKRLMIQDEEILMDCQDDDIQAVTC